MSEQRKHPRTALVLEVKISHHSIESVVLLTRDISESGVFVVTDNMALPPVGSVVEGQVQGEMEDPPRVKMEVVRIEPDGVGLR
ncbi:MAG: PilZ domain-containing protein, partial [Gammaproteobacteria bacterium]|nr:PilZ domain-containing protein [Gammaproteobacteria bacterium]